MTPARRTFCIQAKPHLYLHLYKCGCKVWRARKPKQYKFHTISWAKDAAAQARQWNLQRFCGAAPCPEHHLGKARNLFAPLFPTPQTERNK